MTEDGDKQKTGTGKGMLTWVRSGFVCLLITVLWLWATYKTFGTHCKIGGSDNMLVKFLIWFFIWPVMMFCKVDKNLNTT